MRMGLAVLASAGFALFASASSADTTITITDSACTAPPLPAAVASPVSPNVAAGIAAAKNKDFALARANFQPLAEKGDAEGERALGQLLMQKCTGIQDKAAAVSWLTKASDAGNATAQTQLGQAYLNGSGVAQDDAQAYALFGKAAATGNRVAQTELGYLYLTGRGVASDKYQGMVWTVKAAEQGAPQALSNIAHGYFIGDGLPKDNDKAARYMFAAIQRATLDQRSHFAGSANEIKRAMSGDDLQQAARRAQRWSPGAGSLSDVLDDATEARAKHG
jgi:TPR repeat protein